MNKDKIKEITQECIKNAFIDLCEEEPLQNISVSKICKRADVSRSTFYRFYSNVDDLMKSMEKQYMEEEMAACTDFFKVTWDDYLKDPDVFFEPLKKIWQHHYENRRICRMLLSSNGDPYFTYTMYRHIAGAYEGFLKENHLSYGPYQDMIIRFQVNGILAVMFSSLDEEDNADDEMLKVINKLFVRLPHDNLIIRL